MVKKKNSHRYNRRFNPGFSVGASGFGSKALSGIRQTVKPETWKQIIPVAGGAYANWLLRTKLINKWFPSMAKNQFAQYGIGLLTAGTMLAVPRYGPQLFMGGLVEVGLKALGLCEEGALIGMNGLGLLSEDDDLAAGINDYVTGSSAGAADFLTDYETDGDLVQNLNIPGGDAFNPSL